jgi:hypothetical protein
MRALRPQAEAQHRLDLSPPLEAMVQTDLSGRLMIVDPAGIFK